MGILFASFIIPILPGLVIYGYFYQIMQRVIVKSEEPTLPEWQDWGKLLGDGFRLFGVSFIYSLPMSILYFAGILAYGLMIFSIPWMENTGMEGGTAALIMIGIMSFFFLIVLLAMIFAFVLSVILPLAWCQTIAANSFKGGFEIGKYWKVFRANFGGFLIAYNVNVWFIHYSHDGLLCPLYEFSALVPDPILAYHWRNVNRTFLTGSYGHLFTVRGWIN